MSDEVKHIGAALPAELVRSLKTVLLDLDLTVTRWVERMAFETVANHEAGATLPGGAGRPNQGQRCEHCGGEFKFCEACEIWDCKCSGLAEPCNCGIQRCSNCAHIFGEPVEVFAGGGGG